MSDGLQVLRQPFDPKVVGKLPRVACQACSKRNCDKHKPAKCQVCSGYLTTAHVHLDYVGHAEVTDRLLSADPGWNWEPLAWNEEGFPRFTKGASGELELWIRLTVCGITRLGVGSVAANAFDAEKQLIGDALRNAAMRFGVALDLWAKEELESQLPDDEGARKKAAPPLAVSPNGTHIPKLPPPSVDAATGEVVTKRRPPPVVVSRQEAPYGHAIEDTPPLPMSGRPADQRPCDEATADALTYLIAELKKAGETWAALGREKWKDAGIPSKGAAQLSQTDAERAVEVLSEVVDSITPDAV